MTKRLPPLNALRAFEAAARNLSITKAAQELHVTHAAVSQQLKLLENYLNIPLLKREGKRIALTARGILYAQALNSAFSNIHQATEQLQKQNNEHVLTIRMPQTLALRWFIPRMHDFHNTHPDIELRVSTTPAEIDFSQESIDLAIYYGDGRWPDLHKDLLFEDNIFPVCNPNLLADKSKRFLQENIYSFKFIYITAKLRTKDWPIWLMAAKLHEPPKSSRLYFQDTIQALQAAQAGMGIAIAHEPFVIDDIKSTRLIAPFKVKVKLPNNYYLVCPKHDLGKNKIKKFRAWLLKINST